MKETKNLRFPYPFLTFEGGDYHESEFKLNIDEKYIDNKNGDVILKFSKVIKCPFIEQLIDEGKAIFCVHIEQRTFRKIDNLSNGLVKIKLSSLSPNYNLEVVGMIIAKIDFEFAYQKGMKEIFSYFDESFKVKKGAILGFSNFETLSLPTDSKVNSIFTISEYKDQNDIKSGTPYKIDLNGNVIDIKVLPDIKNNFVELRHQMINFNGILNSLFVYPAIQIAILEMLQNYDNYKELQWCIALMNKITEKKQISAETLISSKRDYIDKDEIIEFTNIVLEDLLPTSLEKAKGE